MGILYEVDQFNQYLSNKGRSNGTIKEYSKDLGMLAQYLKLEKGEDFSLKQVTTKELDSYLDMLVTKKGYKPSSRNRQLNTIRSFYKYCIKDDHIEKNMTIKLELLEVETVEQCFLTIDEVKELLVAIKHPLIKLVVCTLFYTGLRINECLSLTVEDVDFNANTVTVQNGKGNKKRIVPLNNELKPHLKLYIEKWRVKQHSNKLFLTNRTGKLSDVYVNKILKDAVRQLKWDKKVTCHVLRHSFASALVDQNVNIVAVKELLGHASLTTTSGYTHIQRETVEEAIQKINM